MTRWSSLCPALVLVLAATASGQRVIFPTTVAPEQPVYSTSQTPYVSPTTPTPTYPTTPYPVYPATAAPSTVTPIQSPYASPTAPYYTTPAAPPASAAPAAALNGSIQPATPYDPYAPAGTAPVVAPAAPPYECGPVAPPQGFFPGAMRLLQEVQIMNTWVPRQIGNNGFGIDDTVLNASFAVPTRFNPAPVFITPGFNFHSLNGPDSAPGVTRDLPGQTYDAYLGLAWRPQITQRFGADLAISAGAYSDFQRVNWDSLRVLGRALGVYTLSPEWRFTLGIVYLDRLRVKMLPAGGVIWTPNPDVKFDIVFPYPKLAQRFATVGNTDFWGYLAAEYGGGQWSVVHTNGVGDVINYNDIRVMLGMEWFNLNRARGNLEIGYVFDREILYRAENYTYRPGNTMMFRGSIAF